MSKKWYEDTRDSYEQDVKYLAKLDEMLTQMSNYVNGYEKL